MTVRPDRRVAADVRAIGAFFLLAMGITIATGLPVGLSDQSGLVSGAHPGQPFAMSPVAATLLIMIGGFGPALAAGVVIAGTRGREAVGAWLRQLTRWRVEPGWYFVALATPLAVALAGLFLDSVLRGSLGPIVAGQPKFGRIALTFVGSAGEELGWRSFAQSSLQARWGAARASVVVGVLWFVWHNWPVVAPGGLTSISDPRADIESLVYLVAASAWIAWLYNNTRGSALIVVAAHTGLNMVGALLAPTSAASTYAIIVFASVGLGLAVRRGRFAIEGRRVAGRRPI